MENKEIFDNKEAAAFLRVSEITLWRLRKAGLLSFRRIAGKVIYTRQDIQNLLERNKKAATAEAA